MLLLIKQVSNDNDKEKPNVEGDVQMTDNSEKVNIFLSILVKFMFENNSF